MHGRYCGGEGNERASLVSTPTNVVEKVSTVRIKIQLGRITTQLPVADGGVESNMHWLGHVPKALFEPSVTERPSGQSAEVYEYDTMIYPIVK